jgi:ribosome-associated protein
MVSLEQALIHALNDLKAQELVELNVEKISNQFKTLLIVTATSSRHALAIANHLSEEMKKSEAFGKPSRIQKDQEAEWILMDFESVVVHILQKETRAFYNLEKLWTDRPAESK